MPKVKVGEPAEAHATQSTSKRIPIAPGWATVLSAFIGGFFLILGIVVRVIIGSPTAHIHIPSPTQPSISIIGPRPNQHVSRLVNVTGTVRNLHGHVVQLFVESVQPDGTSSGSLYPFGKPCPVNRHHIWTCTGVIVGSTRAYRVQFFIWVAVVTGAQKAADINKGRSPGYLTIVGPDGLPPHVGGSAAVDKLLVARCPKDQACYSG